MPWGIYLNPTEREVLRRKVPVPIRCKVKLKVTFSVFTKAYAEDKDIPAAVGREVKRILEKEYEGCEVTVTPLLRGKRSLLHP